MKAHSAAAQCNVCYPRGASHCRGSFVAEVRGGSENKYKRNSLAERKYDVADSLFVPSGD